MGVNNARRVVRYPANKITNLRPQGFGALCETVPGVKILVTALLMTTAACAYDANFHDCTIRCAFDTGCPEGFTCGDEGFCRSPEEPTCPATLGQSPSCDGLAATCGPSASDGCCSTATPIPGGTFYRSYDVAGDGMYPDMGYPATVSAFVLDKYEVTVGRFRKFVEAGMGTRTTPPATDAGAHAKIAGSGWDESWNGDLAADTAALVAAVKCDSTYQTWTNVAGADENLPMNCVTWYEAMAFCAWDGGYLPTEAEWNFAAAGGEEQRAYPWSSPAGSTEIDCARANYDSNAGYCVSPNSGVNRVGSESPKGDGKWGQADLAGNVFEWALDWYASTYGNPCNDCADLTNASYKVIRGGDFFFGAAYLRGAFRNDVTPYDRYANNGVRCARTMTR